MLCIFLSIWLVTFLCSACKLSSAKVITFFSEMVSNLRKAIIRFCVVPRVEQSYQKVMALWHQLHVNTKSLISWNYLRKDLDLVKTWNLEKVIVKTSPRLTSYWQAFFRRNFFSSLRFCSPNQNKMESGRLVQG